MHLVLGTICTHHPAIELQAQDPDPESWTTYDHCKPRPSHHRHSLAAMQTFGWDTKLKCWPTTNIAKQEPVQMLVDKYNKEETDAPK